MTAVTDARVLLAPDSADTWPQGILAAADLREQRAKAASGMGRDHWRFVVVNGQPAIKAVGLAVISIPGDLRRPDAEHIAAEANPAHALAAVHRWKKTAERHALEPCGLQTCIAKHCRSCFRNSWPCPDLTETADEARAYLGGAS